MRIFSEIVCLREGLMKPNLAIIFYKEKRTIIFITPIRTQGELLINEARPRNPIKRIFGVLKRILPVLASAIKLKLEKVEQIAVACAELHNEATSQNDKMLLEPQISHMGSMK